MAFSQSEITSVSVQLDGCELYASWLSTAPAGVVYQVYLDSRLAWYGTSTRCRVPIPADCAGRNLFLEVATVSPVDQARDFSPGLIGGKRQGRATLSWIGG